MELPTKTGFFLNSTGFTNQTQDGTRIYFTADRVEKISLDTIVATNVQVTACDEDVPKWSFHSKRATIKTGDRVRVYLPNFRVKGVPIVYLPYASVSLKARDRASGFLTPTAGGSGAKGFRLSNAYYQTLGRSADVTLRNDIFFRAASRWSRSRTRANSRSFLNLGFYSSRIDIRPKLTRTTPNRRSSLYAEGVHISQRVYRAAALTSLPSLYRQVFPTAFSRRYRRKNDLRFYKQGLHATASISSRGRRLPRG